MSSETSISDAAEKSISCGSIGVEPPVGRKMPTKAPGEAAIKEEYLVPVTRTVQHKKEPASEEAEAAVAPDSSQPEPDQKKAKMDQGDGLKQTLLKLASTNVKKSDWKQHKKDKAKGMNKQRAGPQRTPPGEKLCPVLKDVLEDEPEARCSYQGARGTCHFLHEPLKYLETKPADLGDTCYMFSQHGRCPAGITCRFGEAHITAEGRNRLADAARWQAYVRSKPTCNQLDKTLQRRLWKRNYDFSRANQAISRFDKRPAESRRPERQQRGQKRPHNGRAAAEHGRATVSPSAPDHEQSPAAETATDSRVENSTAAAVDGVDTSVNDTRASAESGKSNESVGPVAAVDGELFVPVAVISADEAPSLADNQSKSSVSEKGPPPVSTEVTRSLTAEATPEEAPSVPADAAPSVIERVAPSATADAAQPVPSGDTPVEKSIGPVSNTDIVKLRQSEKKKVDWNDQLYLAPLTTVGNLPFRRLCKRLGADITCGEMAMASNLLQGSQAEWALVRRHHSEDVFGAQICGNNPGVLTRVAQLLNEQCQLDFVDINMGCPIDMVFEMGAGSALMRRRSLLENACRSMSSVLDVPLTLKMRTGVQRGVNIAHPLLQAAGDWGVDMCTLHGRSREQRYTKSADWAYVAECVRAASPMPLFGNGDVLSWEEYEARKHETHVAGIMLARGALIKPWIFTEIKERRTWDISSSQRLEILQEYANYGLEHWGSDTEGVAKTRRFLLEWLSFLYRYIPAGLLVSPPQRINERPPAYRGRDQLETLMASSNCRDWVTLSEMVLGKVPADFEFVPKHKANSYS